MIDKHEIVLVGLGAVAGTHLDVLSHVGDAVVVAAVDPAARPAATFRNAPLPVYRTLDEAAAAHTASLVVVTTPTPTHAAVCAETLRAFPTADVLIEKPAADNEPDAARILTDFAKHTRIDIAFHMAFSPEVLWAAELARTQADALGPPVGIRAVFADPLAADPASARARLGTSWIDSGVNALSVLTRFCGVRRRTALRALGPAAHSSFVGRFACTAGESGFEAVVFTSWHVTDATRSTAVRYASGAELVMDHHAVAGHLVLPDGDIGELFGSDGSVPRRESHYRNLYRSYLVDGERVLPAADSLHLHELLLRGHSAG